MKASSILGLNSRTALYSYKYNKPVGKRIAGSKLKTAKVLAAHDIPTPKIIAVFRKPEDIVHFDWSSLPSSFALKPSRGLGGEGIIVVKRRAKDGQGWVTTSRKKITLEDLRLHILDILEGAYSMNNVSDAAFIQEYVGRHKAFRKYAYRGTPDIRVIVFNKVPVMSMLRLPTKESGGRANLHQGAIAAGIDIATGITMRAVWHNDEILYKPGTKKKLRGIKIPDWDSILALAIKCQMATKLGYLGVDIVLHPDRGPMVLELNSQPGLQIQMANGAGLKKRLERVDGLSIHSVEQGVRIAKALFAASFAVRVKPSESVQTISALQEITIQGLNKKKKKVIAKVDTGAWRTSISQTLAEELGLLDPKNVLWTKKFRNALGAEDRPVISATFWLAGRKIITPASVAKRMALRYPVIIGRKDLKGLLVDPHIREHKLDKVLKKEDN